MEGGDAALAAGTTRLQAARAGGKGRFLLATFQEVRAVGPGCRSATSQKTLRRIITPVKRLTKERPLPAGLSGAAQPLHAGLSSSPRVGIAPSAEWATSIHWRGALP